MQFAASVLATVFFSLQLLAAPSPIKALPSLDTNGYLGKWYELARIENEFQISCRGTTAEYTLAAEGTLDVANSCWVGEGSQEKHRIAQGRAWFQPASPAKLKVSFVHFVFWWKPFATDYWILEVGPTNELGQFSYAIVGHPRRRYGWILSRKPVVDDTEYESLLNRLRMNGYEPSLFKRTDQSMNQPKL